MDSIKCFDITKMIVDEATDRFASLWEINDDKLGVLKEYCEAIDSLSEEFNGTAFSVSVDEIKMFVSITLSCEDITIEDYSHKFYALSERGISVSFSVSESGELDVSFVFPSLWERI